jgi:hypothetical protein
VQVRKQGLFSQLHGADLDLGALRMQFTQISRPNSIENRDTAHITGAGVARRMLTKR